MTDSVVVEISLVDFAAMVVAAADTAGFATTVDAATAIAAEILFDLAQTLQVTNHSDFANGFQELENKPNIMLEQFYTDATLL